MRRVFTTTPMSADQQIVKDLLDDAEIPCMVRNENLSTALGELPFTECSPEIWIMHDEDFSRATQLVDAWRTAYMQDQVPWVCRCGEAIEGQFSSCWNCGVERPR